MTIKRLAGLLALLVPAIGFAQGQQNFSCSMNELTRRVEIVSEPGVSVPCEVHYYKDDEAPGERQVLWSAQNETGYCETKTQEFIARLTAMGWDCAQAQVQMPDTVEEAAPTEEDLTSDIEIDDTADLAPAPTDPR